MEDVVDFFIPKCQVLGITAEMLFGEIMMIWKTVVMRCCQMQIIWCS